MAISKTIHGNIVDISGRRIFPGTVTICEGRIADIKEDSSKADGSLPFILPGFIDSHIHIESTLMVPENYARLAVANGIVGAVCDPHEIANVLGVSGIEYMIENGMVGLVREHAGRYPHEFSGGQRQRIGIARSVIMHPELLIADEPISALDVSIQAQVINLLNDLRNTLDLTILFIAHDLSVVKYFSDRIGVMYFGKMVELASSDELFEHPLHPYTKSLLSAIPLPDPHAEKLRVRIAYDAQEAHDYSVDKPTMREITPGHFVYCNDAEEKAYKEELGL